jgi:predicted RNase H-like nuclease (RuvC/YqgF family)
LIAKVEKSNICDDSITNLRNDNSSLAAKIEKLNASLASLKFENDKLITKIRRIHAKKTHSVSHHAFIYKNEASSSRRSTHVKMPKKKSPTASNDHNVSFKTFDASYVLTNKSGKVVAKYVGGKHKGSKTCV